MTEVLYNHSLIVAWIILFAFGICLILVKGPEGKSSYIYNRSRLILGTAFFLFGVQVFLQWHFGFRSSAPYIAVALNITIFYLAAILFGMSFISLLDFSYISRRRARTAFGKWAVCMAVIWAGTLGTEGIVRTMIQIACSVFFFWQACLIILDFFHAYRRAIYKVDNYYADNVDSFVRWLYKSVYGIIFFGLTAAVIAFTPKWCIAIQMSAGVVMFFYIFLSFMSYMLNYATVEVAVNVPENRKEANNIAINKKECEDSVDEEIAVSLEKWVKGGGFRENGVTIEQVATLISSNRTYLSAFINSKYKCTFRVWINRLRMEDAKRLLATNPAMTIDTIARESGFSSGTSFGKLFSECENMTPSKWRKIQGKKHHNSAKRGRIRSF